MAIKEPVSETPATLVADGEYIGEKLQLDTFNVGGDLIRTKEIGAIWGKLSPNPAGFGFVKQEFVDSLPVEGVPRVLYLLKIYDKEVLAGYRPYFWNQENLAFERLTNNNIPNFRAEKGEHKQANETAIEVTEPKITDPLYAKINRGIKGGEIEIPQPNIVNELKDKDLVVKTIEQTEANDTYDLTSVIRNSSGYTSNFKSDTFYFAFKVINGILWIVLSGRAVTKESTGIISFSIDPSEEFKNKYYPKIFRADRTTLDKPRVLANNIASDIFYLVKNGSATTSQCELIGSPDANGNLLLSLYAIGSRTEDGTLVLDIRIPLLLI